VGRKVVVWTDAVDDVLRVAFLRGESASQIAPKIPGATRSGVCGRLARLGLRRGRATTPKAVKPAAPRIVRPRPPAAVRTTNPLAPNAAAAPISHPPPATPEPMPATARPWLSRGQGECAWPIDGPDGQTLSCCAPAEATYCDGHRAVAFAPRPKIMGSAYERSLRRYT
jgi:hypothetical protein